MMSSTACFSADTLLSPSRRESSCRASARLSRSRATGWAPSLAIRPASSSRLVTMTRQPGEPGSRGLDLIRVCGVVQQNQHAPGGEQTAIEGRLGLKARRDLLWWDPKCVQKSPDRLGRFHGRTSRIEASQVHIQLPVRKLVANPVRPLHCQGGLADAGEVPAIAVITTAVPASPPSRDSSSSSWSSSALRPVKSRTRCGNWAGTGRGRLVVAPVSAVAPAGAAAANSRSPARIC